MRWENPIVLFAVWVVPALLLLVYLAHKRRTKSAAAFVDPVMFPRLVPTVRSGMVVFKAAVLCIGLVLVVVALARPRFGYDLEEVSARGLDMFVLLDVSRSMQAEDVTPSRLERAKADIKDLLAKMPEDRVGLVAFAGAAVLKVPLTSDQGFYRLVLDEVDVDSAPRGGSLIGDAIRMALDAMPQAHDRDQVLLLITDGEDHDSFPLEAAKQAAERKVRVFTLGLGDAAEGTRIPVRQRDGSLSYLKHDGQEVFSKMDERLLQQIALETGGAYIPAKTRSYDLGDFYDSHLAGLTRGEYRAEKRKRYREQFQLFLCVGLAMLVCEGLIPIYPKRATHTDDDDMEGQTT